MINLKPDGGLYSTEWLGELTEYLGKPYRFQRSLSHQPMTHIGRNSAMTLFENVFAYQPLAPAPEADPTSAKTGTGR